MMKNTVIKTIKTHNLIFPGAKVLLALSGGSDSVCLLHILNDIKELFGFELFACHLNHSIREEADRDCEFVKNLCGELGIKCFVRKAEVKNIAKEQKISEELAGRNERYRFFKETADEQNINLIATAHNKNDVAETVMMHIIRGSGLDGMKGIAYKRDNIIRPLLDAGKTDIEKYCIDNGFTFVTDKTNASTIYTRNKIRLDLLPKICNEYNPAFVDGIVKNAAIIKDDADYLNGQAEIIYEKICRSGKVSVREMEKLHSAMKRRVILIMYKRYFGNNMNMQSVHAESILSLINGGKSGHSVDIGNNTKCVLESGEIYFKSALLKNTDYEYKLKLGEKIYIPEAGISVTLKEWEKDGEKFFFDNAENVSVRNRRRGDIFFPVGMQGKKKLSDYFTDIKMPISQRNIIPVVTYNNEPVWIVGKRRDRRFIHGKKAYTFIIKHEEEKILAEN